jgi:glycerol-3-phosphate acyltransferase PlsY
MNLQIALCAAVIGYLCGSISFARIVIRICAPQQDISKVRLELPDGSAHFKSDAISASTVRMHVGRRHGCLTSILDMLKAAVPALAFKVWQPDLLYYLLVASMATIGHNWPIYHGFKGGRGLSPILGGMLVVDWIGVLTANLIGALIGMPLNNLLITSGLGIVLVVPWTWLRTQDPAQLAYVAGMNVLYWGSMVPELGEYVRLRREGKLEEFLESAQIRVVGRVEGEIVNQLTLSSVWSKLTSPFRR